MVSKLKGVEKELSGALLLLTWWRCLVCCVCCVL
jgi:hypothetical protein